MEHYGAEWCRHCKSEQAQHMPDGKCLFDATFFSPMSTEEFCRMLNEAYLDPPDDREPFYDDEYFDDYLILKEKHWSVRNHVTPVYDTKDKRFP